MSSKILVIGAGGQIGSELTLKLRSIHGNQNVVASDIHYVHGVLVDSGPFEIVDAQDYDSIKSCVERYKIDTIYLMAAMLSAVGEKHPMKAWNLNMNSLFHVLNLAKDGIASKVFWPSSIAAFGPTTPKTNTPQHTIAEPSTVYGISKLTGERWCEYYHKKYGVDVRSVRYPGIISWKTLPGGGTTDYAIEIYHKAISQKSYACFLGPETELPMMYI
ncbi:MAG: NAD-dependent epimerase/dehydratase family protein, partial [Mangrovimonas sp.]|nr:NAD-dependent epimerase/dehydratase family protein [Mangrovimonas sp.]